MVLSLFFSELRIDIFEQTPSYGFFRLVGKLMKNFLQFCFVDDFVISADCCLGVFSSIFVLLIFKVYKVI